MRDLQESVLAIILLVAGIGTAILVLIFVGVLGGGVYTNAAPNIDILSNSITGETLNLSYHTIPYTYTTSGNIYPGTETLLAWNGTASYGNLVKDTNYTVTYSTGQFIITNLALKNNSYIYVNFSYSTGNPVIEGNITAAIKQSFTALNMTGTYTPIIVLAVIIVIILGLIMSLTPSYRRNEYGYGGAL